MHLVGSFYEQINIPFKLIVTYCSRKKCFLKGIGLLLDILHVQFIHMAGTVY